MLTESTKTDHFRPPEKQISKKICVFESILRILDPKTAFLTLATGVDGDIKINGLFTRENAVRAHYSCRDHFRSFPLLHGDMRF